MDYSSSIDALAFAGKLTVEKSSLNRDNKEWVKLGIEGAQAFLKAMQPPQAPNMSVMGFTLEQIAQIKEAAKRFGLKRIVLFPGIVNGRVYPYFRMYEGNIDAFCTQMGIARMPNTIQGIDESQMEEHIRRYGVIVFEKN